MIKKKAIFVAAALIILLGLAVYANSLDGEFLWDDLHLIEENVHIKDWSNISDIFTKDTRGVSGGRTFYHRPIQMLTYMVDHFLWGLNVNGYHLTNILLHIMAALCLYWLINILYSDRALSLITSALFVVHPVHTEAVAYISGRTDPLAAFFILLCIISYMKHLASKGAGAYSIMLLSYALALLSRESSLVLPLLLFLCYYSFFGINTSILATEKRVAHKQLLPILAITFIYIFLRFTVLSSLLPDTSTNATLFKRTPGFFAAIIDYIRILFLPVDLHMEYGNKLFSIIDPKVILGVSISSLLLVYAFKKKSSDSLVSFSICWFFMALLPVSNIYPVGAYMAEHWLYLPSIGFFLILAKSLLRLYRTERFKIVAVGLLIVLLTFYSYLTVKQNSYWREPITFYKRTLRYAPKSWKTYNNLGMVYSSMDNNRDAVRMFEKAIEVNPKNVEAYYSLGHIYYNTDRMQEAISQFKKAIEIDPEHVRAYNSLGVVHASINAREEAIRLFKKALEIGADYAPAHRNLAKAYYDKGQYNLAAKHCYKAIELGYEVPIEFAELLRPYR
ncbi:tetratricopeptide repeat protein [Omnitrophica bacterium]|nr:tetratricopeptide repeat protein [Candidatus Omnitrophota bacterium]